MPRGGENHAQGGEKIAQGGEKISRALRFARAGQYISSPPWAILVVRPCSSSSHLNPIHKSQKVYTFGRPVELV